MTITTQRSERRRTTLSKERIVQAAITILDRDGESALTFRALAADLETGSGAIYWHIADKSDLLAAAADQVVSRIVTGLAADIEAREGIRAIALGIFDASDAHPWVGAQLSREPDQLAMLGVFEGIGGRLLMLGVPRTSLFDAWSALVNYILGVAAQNAANASVVTCEADRTAFLAGLAARWAGLDPVEYPFLRQVAADLPGHDDRAQFLAGLDLVLAGIATL